jgi:hypothetical protein
MTLYIREQRKCVWPLPKMMAHRWHHCCHKGLHINIRLVVTSPFSVAIVFLPISIGSLSTSDNTSKIYTLRFYLVRPRPHFGGNCDIFRQPTPSILSNFHLRFLQCHHSIFHILAHFHALLQCFQPIIVLGRAVCSHPHVISACHMSHAWETCTNASKPSSSFVCPLS